jgi:peptidoglycan hydrolase-like protein with peptidoglycan-binding domain
MRRLSTFALVLVAIATLGAGCDTGSKNNAAPAAAPTSQTPPSEAAVPSSAPPSPSALPSSPPASPKPPTATDDGKLKAGEKGPAIVALQTRLQALGYWTGSTNGNFGDQTKQAVYALQKAAGLDRDGVVGPQTRQALDRGVQPHAKSTSGYVIEIDLKKQLLMLVNNGKVTQILNTSTGSMKHYEQNGSTYLADTPPGHFKVSRQIDGWRDAPLGLLWRPKYFNGGIAIHGANSVPPYPASHGCARVSIAAMNMLWTGGKVPLKTNVWVY